MKTWTVAAGPLFPGLSRAPVMVTFSFSELLELSPAPAPGLLSLPWPSPGEQGCRSPSLPLSFQGRGLSSTILCSHYAEAQPSERHLQPSWRGKKPMKNNELSQLLSTQYFLPSSLFPSLPLSLSLPSSFPFRSLPFFFLSNMISFNASSQSHLLLTHFIF